jgi:hypothetical protein
VLRSPFNERDERSSSVSNGEPPTESPKATDGSNATTEEDVLRTAHVEISFFLSRPSSGKRPKIFRYRNDYIPVSTREIALNSMITYDLASRRVLYRPIGFGNVKPVISDLR